MRLQQWKHFNSLRQYRAFVPFNGCRSRSDRMNGVYAFCTAAESIKANDSLSVDESPELPDWVKSSDNDTIAKRKTDDDFVPPSISYWIENHKIQSDVENIDIKSAVNDIVESDVDKVSKILNGRFESPDLVVKALEDCDVDVSDGLIEQVLRRFSCQWCPGFGFFKWAELQRAGKKHSPELYNLMIDNLGKAKKFDVIWELVEDMKNFEGYVSLDTMTRIMRRLAKAGRYSEVINTFEKLESFGVERDISAFHIWIDALVKEGSVEDAERLFSDYKDRIPPTLRTYNILVHGWCKIRQIDKAKAIVNKMKEEHGFQPDMITYTSFIEAYCREKDFYKANATLAEMRENGCRPSVVTYTIMMNALAKAKEINKAVKIYEEMKENNCSPDTAFYNVFITALSIAGRQKDADSVFDDMSKQGIIPDVRTYNTLIFIAAHDLQEEKALKLLKKIEERRIKPDINTYIPLLKMCCNLNRMKVLSFLLSHLFANNISLDYGTYSLLVSRLSRNGNLDRACFYFKELVEKGFVPTDSIYDNLVKELEKNGMSKEKQEIEELIASKNFVRMAPEPVKKSKKSKSKNRTTTEF
ncbi:pentatricopeptide repeat-containing protein At3g22670, mitochondrial-like [Andrographis paniculata]|uniref:pentatricopeptide repeat-containing protein At3g22670, mitochondrial-like n=1 Tax=Andrographis paniculata TaxID=175694 RepID=UPI0021E81CEA|nr:pentatricopeptide repeat-containing protein At3g22670, mitochondrial-like [Andrographis paniculata]